MPITEVSWPGLHQLEETPVVIDVVQFNTKADNYRTTVMAELSDGTFKDLFSYFSDELSFSDKEFIGRTPQQAYEIWFRRDQAYLGVC